MKSAFLVSKTTKDWCRLAKYLSNRDPTEAALCLKKAEKMAIKNEIKEIAEIKKNVEFSDE